MAEGLSVPTEFKRMLSWQLSQARDAPVTRSKKKARKKSKPSTGEEENEGSPLPSDEEDDFMYIVVNSEGEEEVYFSAPESPLSSDNEATPFGDFDDAATTVTAASDWSFSSAQCDKPIGLPPQVRKPGGRSKKSKKKTRSLVKVAQVEFFQPLCDLVENKLSVEVGELVISSQAEVPTLVELCIRKTHKEALVQPDTAGLPFLIHSLLGHDRDLRSTVSTHVRWLERLLAALEKRCYGAMCQKYSGFAYTQHKIWNINLQFNEVPDDMEGMHCPLPEPHYMHYCYHQSDLLQRTQYISPLFHFANYFFPLFTAKGKRPMAESYTQSSPLSPSQLNAIGYVNYFLSTRYKELTTEFSEALKLWPAYVYWARGQLKLAADTFAAAIDSLKHPLDQAIALNEMGRLFLQFGERSSACRFFRKSTEVPVEMMEDYRPAPTLVDPCACALRAATWDCGWLDGRVAREAARAWSPVLKESTALPSSIWYLHVAACESRMFVHAGTPAGDDHVGTAHHQPGPPCTLQWLRECVQLVKNHTGRHPILFYHLSELYSMLGMAEDSREAFREFEHRYSGFQEWLDGRTPGHLFVSNPPHHPQGMSPWKPLNDMLIQQGLAHAPVIPLQWRVRMMHPMYPYIRSEDTSYLADHEAPGTNLRLTSDGYLTADIHMDLPPMRCVLIDPYSGALSFPRSASLQHYSVIPYGKQSKSDICALPWPLRVLETDEYVVELVMGSTPDLEIPKKTDINYMAVLHRYDSLQRTHHKLDARRIIRKQLRHAILDIAREHEIEGKEDMLDKMMELGYCVSLNQLKLKEVPSKYQRSKVTSKKGKTSTKTTQKHRNSNVEYFMLQLSHHVVYGEGTLMLSFHLNRPAIRSSVKCFGQVLLFVNCTSCESFLNPRVYCVGDTKGFYHLYPVPTRTPLYHDRHLKHVKYAVVVRTEVCSEPVNDHRQLVFDENGERVYEKALNVYDNSGRRLYHKSNVEIEELKIKFSIGERVFAWQSDSTVSEVHSYSPQMEDKLISVPFNGTMITDVLPAPGVVFVHTPIGLCLLHPGSLEPLKIKGLQQRQQQQQREESHEDHNSHIQFKGRELDFNIVKVYDVEGCSESDEEIKDNGAAEGIQEREEGLPLVQGEEGAGTTEAAEGVKIQKMVQALVVAREKKGAAVRATEDDKHEQLDSETIELDQLKGRLESCDFGSCQVAFTVDDRLLILHISHRTRVVEVVLDVILPGKVTEIHPMGKFGYMLSVTQFPDQFRQDIYWLSVTGKLLGMLPCLGPGQRGFLSATLGPKPQEATTPTSPHSSVSLEDDSRGLYVFFNDGQGGICCMRPSID